MKAFISWVVIILFFILPTMIAVIPMIVTATALFRPEDILFSFILFLHTLGIRVPFLTTLHAYLDRKNGFNIQQYRFEHAHYYNYSYDSYEYENYDYENYEYAKELQRVLQNSYELDFYNATNYY